MFIRKKSNKIFDIWPAYVDILATVLMVLIFVLMTFVIAQLYLSDSIVNKDRLISSLTSKITTLDSSLSDEKERLVNINLILDQLKNDLSVHLTDKEKLKQSNLSLSDEVNKLVAELNRINILLEHEGDQNKKDKTTIEDFKITLSDLERELKTLKSDNKVLEDESVKHKKLYRVHSYRSEFFAKLKDAIGDLDSIKVVGDRFVFQSELLFTIGSVELGAEGMEKLKQLSITLKEIAKKIPEDINWILRVDGHTDKKPMRMAFPSNWELSSARAAAVVKFLIKEGISPKNLVAAGFGEFQPLVEEGSGKDEERASKNRRIEFKLDQR